MNRRRLVVLACLSIVSQWALTNEDTLEPTPSMAPLTTIEELRPLALVGSSQLRVAFFKVFDSKLYSQSGQWHDPSKSFRFELTYSRAISGRFLAKQTSKEWDHLGFSDPRRGEWESAILAMWPDVKKGDTIIFDVDDSGVSRFYYNNEWVGSVEDPDFAPAFIAIWLSPETSRPAHRNGLLAD